jgi:hypothetical protein
LAVSVAEVPLQIVGLFTVTFKLGFIPTVAIAVPVHPNVVPVTVYVVVTTGLTVIGFVAAPVLHEYVVAPLAVKVAEVLAQMVGLFTVTIGLEFTVTITVAVFVQPAAEVPVTV